MEVVVRESENTDKVVRKSEKGGTAGLVVRSLDTQPKGWDSNFHQVTFFHDSCCTC